MRGEQTPERKGVELERLTLNCVLASTYLCWLSSSVTGWSLSQWVATTTSPASCSLFEVTCWWPSSTLARCWSAQGRAPRVPSDIRDAAQALPSVPTTHLYKPSRSCLLQALS